MSNNQLNSIASGGARLLDLNAKRIYTDELDASKIFVEELRTYDNLLITGTKIENLSDPIKATDAANKEYVDELIYTSLSWKNTVLYATTTAQNIVLGSPTSNASGTIDNVNVTTLSDLDRILLKNQTVDEENGIYVVTVSGLYKYLLRSSDLPSGASAAGVTVFVTNGTSNGKKGFYCTSVPGSDVVGTDALFFTKFTAEGTVNQVQFNSGGYKLGASANLTFTDSANPVLGVLGNVNGIRVRASQTSYSDSFAAHTGAAATGSLFTNITTGTITVGGADAVETTMTSTTRLSKGTIGQATSITTPVTLNKQSGVITTMSATTASQAVDSFTVNCTKCKSTSVVNVSVQGYNGTIVTNGIPLATASTVADNSFVINLINVGANALSGNVDISFLIV